MLRRSPEVTYEVVEGQAVLVDPSGKELLTLNQVGTVVWEAIHGAKTEQELVDEVESQFVDVDRQLIEHDVRAFLAELQLSDLVTND